jgi:hypothetical protein
MYLMEKGNDTEMIDQVLNKTPNSKLVSKCMDGRCPRNPKFSFIPKPHSHFVIKPR